MERSRIVHAIALSIALVGALCACDVDERACCEGLDFDAKYRAEYGEGHDPVPARADCQDAGGTLSDASCSREDVVGQCVHERQYDEESQFTYTELYLVGFGNNDYDTPEELAALERACIDLRGGRFVAGADREDE